MRMPGNWSRSNSRSVPSRFPAGWRPVASQALRRIELPLPCARTPIPSGPLGAIIERVLSPFRLAWTDLRIKHLKDVFFSKGSRACLFFPGHLRSSAEEDELHPGRRALRLSFELPKGCYATILVKRITDAAEAQP